MVDNRSIPRLRITLRGALMAVFAFAFAQAVFNRLPASERVIGWALAGAAIAALVYPAVEFLDRRLPRGIAVAIVSLLILAPVALLGWGVVDDVRHELERLDSYAPRAAAELESRDDRLGDFAKRFELERKVRDAVDSIPERLAGSADDPTKAISATATRGLAFFTTGILMLFFLGSGRSMVEAAFRQVPKQHEESTRIVAHRVYDEAFGYARGAIGLAIITGVVAWAVARAANVPGAVVIGLWVGLLDLLPVFGPLVGWAPLVLLAWVQSPGAAWGVFAAFVLYQAVESLVVRRYLERATLRFGRFLPIVSAFAGLELYGVGGALMALLAMAILVSALRAWAELRDQRIIDAESVVVSPTEATPPAPA
jgi:predicted PurR-regulated permease PerM